MNTSILSQNTELIKSFSGSKITQVKRQVFKGDMDLKDFEQMADGPIEIKLDDDRVIYFSAITEIDSIGINCCHMKKYGENYLTRDVSNNQFWKNRIGRAIKSVILLQSKYAYKTNLIEYGIEFALDGKLFFVIEYVNKEGMPDTLRVVENHSDTACVRIKVF